MQLIEFETRLVKDDDNDFYPYSFKTYAKVSLSLQDAKDIELIKTRLHDYFLESIDWKEGTAFFEPFYIGSWDHRFRREETIVAFHRFCKEIEVINDVYRELSRLHDEKNASLNRYFFNKSCIQRETNGLIESLRMRNKFIRDCVDSLSPEECKLIGIQDIYEEFNENDLMNLVNNKKDSRSVDGALIASLEPAYSKDLD